jgi:hypothetical protein
VIHAFERLPGFLVMTQRTLQSAYIQVTGGLGFLVTTDTGYFLEFRMIKALKITPPRSRMTHGTLAVKMVGWLFGAVTGNTVGGLGQIMVRLRAFKRACVMTEGALHLEMVLWAAFQVAGKTIRGASRLMIENHFLPGQW